MPAAKPVPVDADPRPAKPFVKWVGGKRQLLKQIGPYLPAKFGTYHEPFVGGGALFFHLRPKKAVLSDFNDRLVRTWRGVRDDAEGVLKLLRTYDNDEKSFYEMRARAKDIDGATDTELAAWFIYLNKTGFNGLYRVNSKNLVNVPYGFYEDPAIVDTRNLRACSELLQGVDVRHESFEHVASRAKKGDFVYFDPPYVPLTASSSFTTYTAKGFVFADQERLRDVALALRKKGVHVLLSNSAAPLVRELYAEFEIIEVDAARMVNADGGGRGKIKELLIR